MTFSLVKRKFWRDLEARKFHNQVKGIKFKNHGAYHKKRCRNSLHQIKDSTEPLKKFTIINHNLYKIIDIITNKF